MSPGVRLHVPSLTSLPDLFLHLGSMEPDSWMIRLRHQSLKYSTIVMLIPNGPPAADAAASATKGDGQERSR
jgi:hypothetical protein